MKLISCMLFASLFGLTPLTAQRLPKTLLWRISGRDGHYTSYLYGTMHLTDERVFNLGDSLYAAIARADGFAMELDPNVLTTMLVDEVKKGKLTLAELDEEEESLERLRRWYRSIRARDLFGAPSAPAADRRLKDCAEALEHYAELVYEAREPS